MVAYRLQLLEGVGMHLVFHVSFLKKANGPYETISREVLEVVEDLVVEVEPKAVLDKRVIYQDSMPLTQVLVQWSYLHPDNTTWEHLPDLLQ